MVLYCNHAILLLYTVLLTCLDFSKSFHINRAQFMKLLSDSHNSIASNMDYSNMVNTLIIQLLSLSTQVLLEKFLARVGQIWENNSGFLSNKWPNGSIWWFFPPPLACSPLLLLAFSLIKSLHSKFFQDDCFLEKLD